MLKRVIVPVVVEVAIEEVEAVGCGFGYSRSQHSLSGNSLAVTQLNTASSLRKKPAPHIPSTAETPAYIAVKFNFTKKKINYTNALYTIKYLTCLGNIARFGRATLKIQPIDDGHVLIYRFSKGLHLHRRDAIEQCKAKCHEVDDAVDADATSRTPTGFPASTRLLYTLHTFLHSIDPATIRL